MIYSGSILAGCNVDEISYQDMVRAARANKEHLSYIDMEPGTRRTVIIQSVIKQKNVKSSKGRTEKEVHFLKLQGTEKLLWLSIGKLKSLADAIGRDASKWPGQKIVLFADPSVTFGRDVVGGIVIEAAK